MHLKRIFYPIVGFFLVGLYGFSSLANGNAPRIVATNFAVKSLIEAVMGEKGEVILLNSVAFNPHSPQLTPAERGELNQADIIVYIDDEFEFFMNDLAPDLTDKSLIKITQIDGITLFEQREGFSFLGDEDGDEHHDEHQDEHAHDHGYGIDYHIWLYPPNALIIIDEAVRLLREYDPANQDYYVSQADIFKKKWQNLDAELKKKLADIADLPFLVYHDGYHYLENYYDLPVLGSFTISPDAPLSPRRLQAIQELIKIHKPQCVFYESGQPQDHLEKIAHNLNLETGQLDPIGLDIKTSEINGYFMLIERLVDNIHDCLAKP